MAAKWSHKSQGVADSIADGFFNLTLTLFAQVDISLPLACETLRHDEIANDISRCIHADFAGNIVVLAHRTERESGRHPI
jgi:hypothetical protein